MRHAAPLLACVLALATGLALLATGAAIRQPDGSTRSATTGSRLALVRAFYDAANEVLTTGDRSRLDSIVAPDYVEHSAGPGPGAAPGRGGLVQALLSRRAMFPGLRLVVDDVTATGPDRVVARLHGEGATATSVAGLPILASLADWGPLDLFRIADGTIAERWGSRTDSLVVLRSGQTSLDVDPGDPMQRLVVGRFRLPPGGQVDVGGMPNIDVFVIEVGTVEVVAATDLPHTLSAGEFVVHTPPSPVTLRNPGTSPAMLLTFALWPLDAWSSSLDHDSSGGSPAQQRASSGTPLARRGENALLFAADVTLRAPGRVAVGRLDLAPGTVLPIPAGDRIVVVAVGAGQLARVPGDAGTGEGPVVAGEEIVLLTDAGGTWWSAGDGPTSVVVVTIGPVAADGSPARP